MYRVCEGSGLLTGQHTWGDGFSQNKEPEAPSIQSRAVARRSRLTGGGAGHFHLGWACYVHGSQWLPALPPSPTPMSVHLERGGGRKGTQTNSDAWRFPVPLVLKLRSTQHRTHAVFPMAAATWARGEKQEASRQGWENLSTRSMP